MYRYNQQGEIIEIIIRDFSGAKIEVYKFKLKDIERFRRTMNMLKRKYGLDTKKRDEDIDWLKKDEW